MKNTLEKFMQEITFKRLLNNLGIEPAPIFDIDVIDAEIVEPNNVQRFNEWYCNHIKGIYSHDNHKMTRGYERVANHKINQNGK